MITNQYTFRVRYSETDQMGVVNNAHYPTFFEMGRTELFRQIGIVYADLEREGVMLPVSELFVKYFKPSHYDDILTIETTLKEMHVVKLRFEYRLLNENAELIAEGYTILAFLNGKTRRPMRMPEAIHKIMAPRFAVQIQ